MYDPTDGCPECGTVSATHAEDCDYLNRPAEFEDEGDVVAEAAEQPQPHPFPWRAMCLHCNQTISKDSADRPWELHTLHGRDAQCEGAPLIDGDLIGYHEPRVALSINGPVA